MGMQTWLYIGCSFPGMVACRISVCRNGGTLKFLCMIEASFPVFFNHCREMFGGLATATNQKGKHKMDRRKRQSLFHPLRFIRYTFRVSKHVHFIKMISSVKVKICYQPRQKHFIRQDKSIPCIESTIFQASGEPSIQIVHPFRKLSIQTTTFHLFRQNVSIHPPKDIPSK